jgi:hypothetical protein
MLEVAKIRVDASIFEKRAKKLEGLPQSAMEQTFPFLKKSTPKRSGNARSKTKYNRSQDKIESNYPYAGRLDEGWSKQAPKGFTTPSIGFLERAVNKLVGKV